MTVLSLSLSVSLTVSLERDHIFTDRIDLGG